MGVQNNLFNKKQYKDLRMKLRSQPSLAEQILWHALRGKQIAGYKFRRQFGIGTFVVDFYCPALHLAIELDGETHDEKHFKYDRDRQRFIEAKRIRIIRFANQEVYKNLSGVVQEIINQLPNNHP
ncbi:endonuclease domain-containing protein [Candidatus Microgenomates bacterium]|nr:MAG: endonuclease domain-containing protein [Candidatus Microgenomates bacterium]